AVGKFARFEPAPRQVRAAPMKPIPAALRPALLPGATLLAVLAALQLLTFIGVLPARSFPLVTDVFAALVREAGTAAFWIAVGHTLSGWAIGLLIAIVLAIPLGIVLGSSLML